MSEKPQNAPQSYTFLWFVAMILYGYQLERWAIRRVIAYLSSYFFSVLFWVLPALKRWHYKRYKIKLKEHFHKRWIQEPISTGLEFRIANLVFIALVIYPVLLWWFLDSFLWVTLGHGIGFHLKKIFTLLPVGGFNIFERYLSLIVLLTIIGVAFLAVEYLIWNDRHVAYIEEFERRFTNRQKFLIWVVACAPTTGLLLAVAFHLLLIKLGIMS